MRSREADLVYLSMITTSKKLMGGALDSQRRPWLIREVSQPLRVRTADERLPDAVS